MDGETNKQMILRASRLVLAELMLAHYYAQVEFEAVCIHISTIYFPDLVLPPCRVQTITAESKLRSLLMLTGALVHTVAQLR
jgi:hypothetical protein